MRRGRAGRVLLGLVLVQLVLPAAWAFSLHGLALRPASAGLARAPAISAQPRFPAAPPRPFRGAACMTLAATAGSVAVDPETAWAQYAAGDSTALAAIAPTLTVLTPGDGSTELTVGDYVGEGKGLIVFMRHVG